ncbi:MAG: tRNA modification GTPase [Bianqueaceae bacterium]
MEIDMADQYNGGPAIAAISTPAGTGAIAIIRISGRESIEIVDAVFQPADKSSLRDSPSHTIHYGWIVDPQTQDSVDEVLVMLMRAPRTFTREDVVEINCHGGAYIQGRILELLFQSGARLAEPGEFTKRAFLNGRMDLSQAEAVMDLISSQTDLSLRSSIHTLKGGLREKIDMLRGGLLDLMTQIEANIDYPEYDLEDVTLDQIQKTAAAILEKMEDLWRTAESGRLLKQGIKVAIVGAMWENPIC